MAAHRRPESVLVLVYSTCGEVLLLRRHAPFSFWQSVTGCLDPGEDHANAARRELAEETGIEAGDALQFSGNVREFEIDPRWRHRYAPGITHNTEYEWRLRVESPCAIRIDDSEHAAFCWMPLRQAPEAVWSWTNREALLALQLDLSHAAD